VVRKTSLVELGARDTAKGGREDWNLFQLCPMFELSLCPLKGHRFYVLLLKACSVKLKTD
jgi:hypothetical protein